MYKLYIRNSDTADRLFYTPMEALPMLYRSTADGLKTIRSAQAVKLNLKSAQRLTLRFGLAMLKSKIRKSTGKPNSEFYDELFRIAIWNYYRTGKIKAALTLIYSELFSWTRFYQFVRAVKVLLELFS